MTDEHRDYEVPTQQVAHPPPPPPPPPPPAKSTVYWGALVRSWRFWVALAVVWVIGIGIGAATPPEEDQGDTETAAQQTTTTEEVAQSTTTEEPTTTEAPTTTAPPTTPAPTQPPGPATSFGSGTQVVNQDIAPGTYRAEGGDRCYWERLSGFSGTVEDIIANGGFNSPVIVEIAATDVGFNSNDCGTWEQAG